MPKLNSKKIARQITIRIYDDTAFADKMMLAYENSCIPTFNEFCVKCLKIGLQAFLQETYPMPP